VENKLLLYSTYTEHMELWPTINQKITLKGIKSDGKTIYNVTKDVFSSKNSDVFS